MAARKRRAVERMGSDPDRHLVREVDVLRETGPGSLAAVAGELDPEAGLAIITEGLLGYLSTDAVHGVWGRFASALGRFASGVYISDIHVAAAQDVAVRAFRVLLSVFVRGRVYLHFDSAEQVVAALAGAGFAAAEVRPAAEVAGLVPRGRSMRMAHILEVSST